MSASNPAVDMAKTFDFDWLDKIKLERAINKKKEGLEEMKQFIEDNKVLDPKADYSNIVKFIIGLSRQTNNAIKKDAVEIAILLANNLKLNFKTQIFEITGPFIDMLERGLMSDTVLEFITNMFKVYGFDGFVPAVL